MVAASNAKPAVGITNLALQRLVSSFAALIAYLLSVRPLAVLLALSTERKHLSPSSPPETLQRPRPIRLVRWIGVIFSVAPSLAEEKLDFLATCLPVDVKHNLVNFLSPAAQPDRRIGRLCTSSFAIW